MSVSFAQCEHKFLHNGDNAYFDQDFMKAEEMYVDTFSFLTVSVGHAGPRTQENVGKKPSHPTASAGRRGFLPFWPRQAFTIVICIWYPRYVVPGSRRTGALAGHVTAHLALHVEMAWHHLFCSLASHSTTSPALHVDKLCHTLTSCTTTSLDLRIRPTSFY